MATNAHHCSKNTCNCQRSIKRRHMGKNELLWAFEILQNSGGFRELATNSGVFGEITEIPGSLPQNYQPRERERERERETYTSIGSLNAAKDKKRNVSKPIPPKFSHKDGQKLKQNNITKILTINWSCVVLLAYPAANFTNAILPVPVVI